MRKGIAEETADAQRHIDTRPAEFRERQNLDPLQPPRLCIPNWLNPEQREGLSNVVSVGAHLGGSPDTQAHHLRVRTFFFAEALDGLSRELLPHAPSRLRWKRSRVDCVEVMTTRQNVSHTPRRR